MRMRVFLARAAQPDARIVAEAEFFGVELAMLPGKDQRRLERTRDERMRQRSQLDRFRPGPDDQPYVGSQPSS